MLFNSIDFAVFFPIAFLLYWVVFSKTLKLQNIYIVIVSYIFYCWWDWRFLSLILISTITDFYIGKSFYKISNQTKRKSLLKLSILINIGILLTFKYYNFFVSNFVNAFSLFGYQLNINTLNIILPIGISFYTFQTLGYTIDCYKQKTTPTNNLINFAAFVSFFPQLVAGPIERASNLLPQFNSKRLFNYNAAIDGLRQILWGLFKKMVIADNCAILVNHVFNEPNNFSGSTLALAAIFFSFQIYCDFSGYSDIAIGTSRLLGFNLKQNFAFPYFSKSIVEFWRRWHISLSTWFRDYVYIPLGGNRGSLFNRIKTIFIVFIVSGLWHGANWTFVTWGALNAIYFVPYIILNKKKAPIILNKKASYFGLIKNIVSTLFTFILITLGWIIFRAETVTQALVCIKTILSHSFFTIPEFIPKTTILLLIVFICIEWLGKQDNHALEKLGLDLWRPIRLLLYYIIIIMIITLSGPTQDFIYFKF